MFPNEDDEDDDFGSAFVVDVDVFFFHLALLTLVTTARSFLRRRVGAVAQTKREEEAEEDIFVSARARVLSREKGEKERDCVAARGRLF
jgi:hypothetical protein